MSSARKKTNKLHLYAAACKVFELSMSETSDEEVDYGSFESIANPPTDSDHAWSTTENAQLRMIVQTK